MNINLILPEISLFCGALFILMSDVFLAKKIKGFFCLSHLLSLIVCGLSIFLILGNFSISENIFNQMFVSNSFTSFAKVIAVLLLSLVIVLSLNFVYLNQKISAEFLALLMIATTGGMILVSANDFLVFYLGLELQALSLYLLAAIKRNSGKSSEAGMKYFILGSLASGILLFGISMIYGFSGTTNFSALTDLYHNSANQSAIPVGVMFGFILVITAMFFKIAAAPFHMWSPDVYEGSSSIVTTFFATVAKFTALMALLKLFATLIIGWPGIEKIFIFTAITSIAVGSFGAIFQKNLKRLLAFSSVSHVGFILLGMAAFHSKAFTSCVLYALIYAIISIGSFGFLTLIKDRNQEDESDESNEKIFNISALSGLAKTNPVMAFSFATLMFSTAGIPPLAGFFSKFYILSSFAARGFFTITVIAILLSVVSAFYYLRIIKIMYFDEPKNEMEFSNLLAAKIIVFISAFLNIALIFSLGSLIELIANFLNF
jgi:NADH-quinone oxidoreductase subunit N